MVKRSGDDEGEVEILPVDSVWIALGEEPETKILGMVAFVEPNRPPLPLVAMGKDKPPPYAMEAAAFHSRLTGIKVAFHKFERTEQVVPVKPAPDPVAKPRPKPRGGWKGGPN